MKKNCWEIKNCGRQPGGNRVQELGECKAATYQASDGVNGGKNAGRYCWAIAGTLCGGEVQGSFAQKQKKCNACEFFISVKKDEGDQFSLV